MSLRGGGEFFMRVREGVDLFACANRGCNFSFESTIKFCRHPPLVLLNGHSLTKWSTNFFPCLHVSNNNCFKHCEISWENMDTNHKYLWNSPHICLKKISGYGETIYAPVNGTSQGWEEHGQEWGFWQPLCLILIS